MCDNHVAPEQPIDLINVAFMSDKIKISSSPDRAAALLSFEEMKRRWPNRSWRFIAVDVPYDEVLKNEERICRLISPLDSTMDFNIATAFWFASRGQGIEIHGDQIAEVACLTLSKNNRLQALHHCFVLLRLKVKLWRLKH